MKLLTQAEAANVVSKLYLPWKVNRDATKLTCAITFPDFLTAFTFVTRVAVHAEIQKHHPDINLSYGRVRLTLTTHEHKGLTQRDVKLAKAIDAAINEPDT